jgi:hypothetical protein
MFIACMADAISELVEVGLGSDGAARYNWNTFDTLSSKTVLNKPYLIILEFRYL